MPLDNNDGPASRPKPGGSGVSAVNVYDPLPPNGFNLSERLLPCWKVPRLGPALKPTSVGVGPAIFRPRFDCTIAPAPSLAWTVTLKFPVFNGVPLTTPVAGSSDSPVGSGALDQV